MLRRHGYQKVKDRAGRLNLFCRRAYVRMMADDPKPPSLLPASFADWFAMRGWSLRPHQADLIEAARRGQGGLVIAPTGGGKTLAGFLPSLIELAATPPRVHPALHTLYVSPLKALATDVARNLGRPVKEMNLDISMDTRTGDTPASRRQQQREQSQRQPRRSRRRRRRRCCCWWQRRRWWWPAGQAAGYPADDAGAAGAAGGIGACSAVLL